MSRIFGVIGSVVAFLVAFLYYSHQKRKALEKEIGYAYGDSLYIDDEEVLVFESEKDLRKKMKKAK